jgi:YidC/Oxa1 family membrane protein insertase
MMDKKTILIVVGCLVALLASQALINKIYPPKPKAPRPATVAVTNPPSQPVAAPKPAEKPAETAPAKEAAVVEPDEPRPTEQTITLTNDYVRIEFTGWGGGVKAVELLKHKANGSGHVVLNGKDFIPALAITGVTNAGSGKAYDLEQSGPNTVVMKCRTRTGLEITKTFNLGDAYLLSNSVEIVRASEATVALPVAVGFIIGTATPVSTKEAPNFLTAGWLAGEKYQYRDVNHITKNAGKGITGETINARWGAVNNQFFTKILTPGTNAVAIEYQQVELTPPPDWSAKQPPQGVSATLKFPPTSTTADTAERYEFTWYAGPKEYDRLAALGHNQEEVMALGSWMDFYSGIFGITLLKSMKFFYKLIPNYGVAIIIITILIKILFWPIQAKSIKSMKAMQKFQPLMNKLREKYKDDAQRLNSEMMKLYKEHKINPFAGCLPMVVQIPVFFALFTMLRSAVELRGASFLWIRDLSVPDTLFHISGYPVNLLPLLMTGLSVWQMKITPQTGDQQQQKMMMFMPLMMLFFFYSTSSGLVLYWTVQQFLSIAQQWWGMRQADSPIPAGPMAATGKTK